MADLSLNKDIYRKFFGHSGNQNDPSGGGLNQKNPFFESEIGRDTGNFKVSVAKKLKQLKSNEISVLAGVGDNNINLVHSQKGRIDSQEDRLKPFVPGDVIDWNVLNPDASHYAEMGSGGPGTAADDQRVHEAAYVAQQIKDEFKKGFNFGGENDSETLTTNQDIISKAAAELMSAQLNGASDLEIAALEGQLTSLTENLDLKTAEYLQNHDGRNSLEEYEYQDDKKAELLAKEREIEKAAKLAEKIALREFNAANAAADLKLQRIAREQEIEKAESAFTRKKEDTRQNKLIEERANKSDKAAEDARKVSEQKANELRLLKSSNEDSLNSKTYGRDENKVLITPGNETLLIDTIADNAITGEGDTLGSLTAQIITERDTPKFLTPADIEARRSVNDGATPQKHFVEYQKQAQERLATKDYRTARERLLDKIKKDNADAEKAPVEKFKRVGEPGSLHGSDPFRFTTLQYPENVTTDKTNGHYILFYVNVQNKTKYKYDGYNDDGDYIQIGDVLETQHRSYQDSRGERFGNYIVSGTEESDFSSQPGPAISTDYTYSKGAEVGEIEYQKQQHSSGKPGNILQSNQVTLMKQRKASSGLASVLDLTSRITDSVALYLPANVENATSTGYQGFKTGMAGFLALSGLDVIDKIRNHDYEGAADGFMGMGGTIIYDMIRKAGISAFGAATRGEGVQENFDKAFGQTMNPFIDVAFDTMGLRSFEYTFDFRPKSATESTEVDAIIKLFRFHMVPELKGTNHRYMTLPSTFDIHYMYQTSPEEAEENPFYNKIATCVLEDCRVNYAPGETIQTFQSGAPTHITMTLKFMETEMLTKEKVNKGF